MKPIIASYCFTVEDLLAGRKYGIKTKRSRWFWFFVPILPFSFGWLSSIHIKDLFHGYNLAAALVGLLVPLCVIIAVSFLIRWIVSFIIRRQFAKRPDANQDVVWEFSESGIAVSSRNSKSEIKWQHFYKVLATPAGFLFMPIAQIFHFIPNRAFESAADIENLKILARQCAREFKELK